MHILIKNDYIMKAWKTHSKAYFFEYVEVLRPLYAVKVFIKLYDSFFVLPAHGTKRQGKIKTRTYKLSKQLLMISIRLYYL